MTAKLTLTVKSLLLVCIPIVFEIGLVAAVLGLQHDTEIQAQRANEAHQISQKLTALSGKTFALWKLYSLHKQSDIPDAVMAVGFFKRYQTEIQPMLLDLSTQFQELKESVKEKPDLAARVLDAQASLSEIRDILEQALTELKAGRIADVTSRYRKSADRIIFLFQRLTEEEFDLVQRFERDYSQVNSQRQITSHKLIVQAILFIGAINALFCLALALFLVKGIVNRIGIMQENARRLADSQPLNKPIGGHDELSELDQTFHSMAGSLEESARIRQELVNMLTHDLRSPLTTIQGSLDLLDTEIKEERGEREKRLIDIAQRNSSRMMRLINDLLDIQKIKAGMMTFVQEKVCIAEVFEEVALSVGGWAEDNGIKIKCVDTAEFVIAEREKVERIIFNLVANAIKFSPKGGTIELSASCRDSMVQIDVTDEGRGIPAAQMASIFERFQQLEGDEKKFPSSGLGLTICQYLVTLQGGKIWVSSEVGKGSCFSFTLPAG